MNARRGLKIVIIPATKPLQCWLVQPEGDSPDGPHEVHAFGIAAESIECDSEMRRSAETRPYEGGFYFDTPSALAEEHESLMDIAPATIFFVPTAWDNCNGGHWFEEEYVAFSQEQWNDLYQQKLNRDKAYRDNSGE